MEAPAEELEAAVEAAVEAVEGAVEGEIPAEATAATPAPTPWPTLSLGTTARCGGLAAVCRGQDEVSPVGDRHHAEAGR